MLKKFRKKDGSGHTKTPHTVSAVHVSSLDLPPVHVALLTSSGLPGARAPTDNIEVCSLRALASWRHVPCLFPAGLARFASWSNDATARSPAVHPSSSDVLRRTLRVQLSPPPSSSGVSLVYRGLKGLVAAECVFVLCVIFPTLFSCCV